MAQTITLAPAKGPHGPDSVQVEADGKRWLFQAGRAVENVPDKVVKELDKAGAKYDTGKGE